MGMKGRNISQYINIFQFVVRLSAKSVDLVIEMKLGTRPGDKILVTDFDMKLDLDNINLELECLFPKNGQCCPGKYLKSCTSSLAKVVLRYVKYSFMNIIGM